MPQSITFDPISNKTCSDSIFTISATASSGLPVSFYIQLGSATINGNSITITGAGTIIIVANQLGNDIYDSATSVTSFFQVTSAFYTYNHGDFIISLTPNYCVGDQLNFKSTSIPGISYKWTDPLNRIFSTVNLKIDNLQTTNSGVYNLKISEGKCIFIDTPYSVSVIPRPSITLTGLDSTVNLSDSPFKINALPIGGTLTGLGIVGNEFDPLKAGLGFHIINYSANNSYCISNYSKTIHVLDSTKRIMVYEVIKPNSNSFHNVWKIDNIENFSDNEVCVYDAWGNIVFSMKGYKNQPGWNASNISSGSYLYIVKAQEIYKGTLFVDK